MNGFSADLRELLEHKCDAMWVRARIKALFNIDSPPEGERIEKSFMFFGFVAVILRSRKVACLFECTDYYGSSHLFFSEQGPEPEIQSAIASAFWEMLLSDPEQLAEFSDKAYHVGAGIWMAYGYKQGEFFYEEEQE